MQNAECRMRTRDWRPAANLGDLLRRRIEVIAAEARTHAWTPRYAITNSVWVTASLLTKNAIADSLWQSSFARTNQMEHQEARLALKHRVLNANATARVSSAWTRSTTHATNSRHLQACLTQQMRTLRNVAGKKSKNSCVMRATTTSSFVESASAV